MEKSLGLSDVQNVFPSYQHNIYTVTTDDSNECENQPCPWTKIAIFAQP